MIYRMARELQDRLRTFRFPVTVDYTRRLPDGASGIASHSHHILIQRDTSQGDTFSGPQGRAKNVRTIGVEARVYVRVPASGARQNEHENECDLIVDALVLELGRWVQTSKLGVDIAIREARYLTTDELGVSDFAAGVVYLLRFGVPRGITERYYDGHLRPVGAPAAFGTASVTVKSGPTEEVVPLDPPPEE